MLDLTFAEGAPTVAQWLVPLMVLLDLIVGAAVVYGLSRFGSRPDAEQLSGIAVIAAVVGATEFTLVMIAIGAIPSWVRVVSSLAAFTIAIFCASKNWRLPSLRGTLVLAIGLIGFLVLSIGRSTLTTQARGTTLQDPVLFFDAIRVGAEAVIKDLPFQQGSLLNLDVAGWVVLAALAFCFWRVVERRSAQQLPGPVTMELTVAKSPRTPSTNGNSATANGRGVNGRPESGAGRSATPVDNSVGTDPDAQLAVFRAALLQNVIEPGAVPGAPALLPLTDLMEFPIAATWLSPIASVIKNIFATPTGYKVLGEVVPPDTNGGEWVVLARVIDVATGEQVDVSTHRCASDVHACRTAGYWAATVILGRSSRIASWARWDKGTADALATYNNLEHSKPGDPGGDLEKAVAQAPSSGVLLLLLAARHDLMGNHLVALSLYARAVAAHPRYPVARYRMTISVGMLARNTINLWLESCPDDRARIVAQLTRACNAMRVDPNAVRSLRDLITPYGSVDEARKRFQALATELLRVLRQDTNYWGLVSRSFRRSERDSWWLAGLAKFGRSGPRQMSRSLILSASLLNGLTDSEKSKYERRILTLAARSDSKWELCYNLACYYSCSGQFSDALTWLETALERPESGRMHREWVDVDPDLKRIHCENRFNWVVAQLSQSQDEEDGSLCPRGIAILALNPPEMVGGEGVVERCQ